MNVKKAKGACEFIKICETLHFFSMLTNAPVKKVTIREGKTNCCLIYSKFFYLSFLRFRTVYVNDEESLEGMFTKLHSRLNYREKYELSFPPMMERGEIMIIFFCSLPVN
jgi:hypothetical protein